MKKISLVIVLLSGSMIIACNNKQPQQSANTDQEQAVLKDTLLNTFWSVKGCAEIATRSNTKFPDSGDFKDYPPLSVNDVGVKAMGDSIVYNRFEEHLCCRKVKVTAEKKENIITITEYWFGQGCKCKCSSTVHAVIRELAKGEYQVYGIATGTDPFDDKPTQGRDTVINQLVIIK